jgi:hypothetical protein
LPACRRKCHFRTQLKEKTTTLASDVRAIRTICGLSAGHCSSLDLACSCSEGRNSSPPELPATSSSLTGSRLRLRLMICSPVPPMMPTVARTVRECIACGPMRNACHPPQVHRERIAGGRGVHQVNLTLHYGCCAGEIAVVHSRTVSDAVSFCLCASRPIGPEYMLRGTRNGLECARRRSRRFDGNYEASELWLREATKRLPAQTCDGWLSFEQAGRECASHFNTESRPNFGSVRSVTLSVRRLWVTEL